MTTYEISDFQQDVLELSKSLPVLVDFWAAWCGPCRMLGPVLERLAERHAGSWELRKVDTEAHPDVARTYGIRSIPNVKLFVDGAPVNEFVGALPESAIEQWLKTALPDRHGASLDTAETMLSDQRDQEARVILERVLSEAPGHERASTLLALSLFFEEPRRALALVEQLDAGGVIGERVAAIRTFDNLLNQGTPDSLPDAEVKPAYLDAIAALRDRDFDAALGGFIGVLKSFRYFNDDAARKACIAIFKYLGEDHPITLRHRREFDRSLY